MVVGDWVKARKAGVWQIYRILQGQWEMRYSLSSPRARSMRTTVFVRRLVNAEWQRAFSAECCDQSFIQPLSREEKKQLDEVLKDQRLRESFQRYSPKPIDLIVNLPMGVPDRRELDVFCKNTLSPAMDPGIAMDDVLKMLDEANLARFVSQYPITATLQMVCRDHEVRNGEFVLRSCKVLGG